MDELAIKSRKILARLDRLESWPYPTYYLLILGIGFFFGFYDILTIGFALPKIQQVFSITLNAATWTITSSLIGYIIGSFFVSRIADNFGRKHGLIISISFFTLGSLACAVSFNLAWLIFWRFITGIGIGAEIASVTTYIEELAPAPIRGRATCIAIAFGMIGFAVVPFVAYGLVPNYHYGWRILFLIGGIAGIFIYYTRRFLPDSPRWLVIKNRLNEAEAIVANAEQFLQNKGQRLTAPSSDIPVYPLIRDTSLANFLQPATFKHVLLFSMLWFVYYIGNYAWLTLAPSLLIRAGYNLSESIGFIAISSFGFVLGSALSITIIEKIERKWSAIFIAIIWSIALIIIGWLPNPMAIIIAGFVATTSIATIIPILYIYTAEHFPTRVRATGLAVTDGLGHLGGAFCGQIIFQLCYLLTGEYHNFRYAFTIMAITGIMTAILLLFGKKTTGISLTTLAK